MNEENNVVPLFAAPTPQQPPREFTHAQAPAELPPEMRPKTQLPAVLIPPTVGRRILFYPGSARGGYAFIIGQEHSADIAFVHSDRVINIMALDSNGNRLGITSVKLVHEGDPIPSGDHCRWMPYQVGQARRA